MLLPFLMKEGKTMKLETKRLVITKLTADMAQSVHENSLDEDNRRFVPDEVFETVEIAQETVNFLISCYEQSEGPLVYPILLRDGTNIGYVQAVPLTDGVWEIGYHVGKKYTKCGYATEAVQAFLPWIMDKLHLDEILGVCLKENAASVKVMERCGFVKVFEGAGDYQGAEKEICKFVYKR